MEVQGHRPQTSSLIIYLPNEEGRCGFCRVDKPIFKCRRKTQLTEIVKNTEDHLFPGRKNSYGLSMSIYARINMNKDKNRESVTRSECVFPECGIKKSDNCLMKAKGVKSDYRSGMISEFVELNSISRRSNELETRYNDGFWSASPRSVRTPGEQAFRVPLHDKRIKPVMRWTKRTTVT